MTDRIDRIEWKRGAERTLQRFIDEWERGHRTDPEAYPLAMTSAEWNENFAVWMEVNGRAMIP